MATHDYNVANQAGSLFRGDLNDVLNAIVSNNSSASEPTTLFAYMWWYDSTNSWLKRRNSTNTAWVNVLRTATNAPLYHPIQSKASTYTVLESDLGSVLRATASITFDLTASATLGNGWWSVVQADGGTATIDPAGSELVNGAATFAVPTGYWALLTCDGGGFKCYAQPMATTGGGATFAGALAASNLSGTNTGDNPISQITNTLSGNVALNSTSVYRDGPSVAQGSTGTWFASGTITVGQDSTATSYLAVLSDGTTVIAAASKNAPAGAVVTFSLSGVKVSPAGNLRIAALPGVAASADGFIFFNTTGHSKDSTITAIRIAQ